MKVAAIVVNYRTPELSAKAATALLPEIDKAGGGCVVIVENDSRDDSLTKLHAAATREAWGARVTIVESPRNGGYGYGINVGVEHVRAQADAPEYVYVLNPDAVPGPGSLARMVAFLDAHPDVGVAGNEVRGEDGGVQAAAFNFPSAYAELEEHTELGLLSKLLHKHVVSIPTPSESREVDWIPGTSMLVRRTVFDTAGLFDEGFFLYFEEIDFCRRVRLAGHRVYFIANAPITHIGSVSTGMVDQSKRMPTYWFDSRHRYFLKHHGRGYTAVADAAWAAGIVFGRIKRRAQGTSRPQRPRLLRDFIGHSLRRLLAPGSPPASEARVEPKTKRKDHTPGASDPRPARDLTTLELIAEDFATYDRDPLEPGFWAVAVHRLGERADALPGPQRQALSAAHAVLSTAVDLTWGIHLPRTVALGRRVRIWHSGGMLLHARAIGNDVHLRHATTFGPVRAATTSSTDGLPTIEDRADIGSGVCVLGNVTVGHDAMIGANSVVLKPVPPNATVLGVPARLVPT